MATALRLNSSDLSPHQATIAASLAHRFAIAEAAQNSQLIALLEREKQQLEREFHKKQDLSTLVDRVKQAWHSWMEAIDQSSQLSVQKIVADGVILWHAYDPKTGKTLYAESTSEVVKWIEDNNLGR